MRADYDLGFLLQYENVAWYEEGVVTILDRRRYPRERVFVACRSVLEVANAITDMVTQSGGPPTAAGMAMALQAGISKHKSKADFYEDLTHAAKLLIDARPTTRTHMERVTKAAIEVALLAREEGQDPAEAVFRHTVEAMEHKYKRILRSARSLVDYFPSHGTILTQCYGETIVGLMIREAKERQKTIKMICAETRPYFQGARLTASLAFDMGVDVTVITDNMPGYVMSKGIIDVFTSASDVITMDGHVINKIGTFQMAMMANHFGIPYYPSGEPDLRHPTPQTITIEERDGEEVLLAMGIKTAMDGVKGYYPAFDITPPQYITGIVTDGGVFLPGEVYRYHEK